MEIYKNRKGFSLVELAIVIMIIGMLFALGLKMLGPMVQRLKHTDTKESINAAVQAVIGFAAVNNRLPLCDNTFITAGNYCQDDDGTDGDGVSDNTYDEFLEVIRTKSDVWNNDFIYIPAAELLSDDTVCERKTTTLTLKDCGNSTDCSSIEETIENVAFIVLSKGENMNLQSFFDVAVISSTIQTYNPGLLGIDEYAADIDRDEPYKDIVSWMTLDELRIKAGCIGGQLRVLTDALPACQGGTPYSATIFADGGVPFTDGGDSGSDPDYKWCREESSSSGITFLADSGDPLDTDCENEVESGAWIQSSTIEISGTPTEYGSFNFTFWVRDNNESGVNDDVGTNKDNIDKKSLILTVDPICICELEARNKTTPNEDVYYELDGGSCTPWTYNSDILISPGETLVMYTDAACSTESDDGSGSCSYTHLELKVFDTEATPDCDIKIRNDRDNCDWANR